jgi:hypothetical protein
MESTVIIITKEHIEALGDLIEKSPTLLEQLKQCKSINHSASLLAEAARQGALPIDEEALRAHLEKSFEKNQKHNLSDAQLDAVAGGQLGGDNTFTITADWAYKILGYC